MIEDIGTLSLDETLTTDCRRGLDDSAEARRNLDQFSRGSGAEGGGRTRGSAPASDLLHQRRDAAHRNAAVEALGLCRRDLEEAFPIALHDHVFGRHLEIFGQRKRD